MRVEVTLTVVRDDGTTLTRTERVANDTGWVRGQRRRLTRAEMRRDIDARIAAALNATVGRK